MATEAAIGAIAGRRLPAFVREAAHTAVSARWLGSVVALAGAYAAMGAVGFLAAPKNPVVSAMWAPAGIALACLLLWGRGLWPGIWIGAAAVNVAGGEPLATAFLIGGGTTLGTVCAASLMFRRGVDPSLHRVRDVLSLIAFGAFAGPLISATVGISSLVVTGSAPLSDATVLWLTWWTGDALGVLCAAPLLLIFSRRSDRMMPGRALEWIALMATLVAVTIVLFRSAPGYVYGVFPLTMVIALRLGQRGATAATAIVATLAAGFTIRASGPFVAVDPANDLFLMQLFVGLLALKGLVLSTALTERARMAARAYERASQLAQAQELAGLGVWEWDPASDRVELSAELQRMLGTGSGGFAGPMSAYVDRVHPDDRDRMRSVLTALTVSDGPLRFEERIVRPDGTVRILDSVAEGVRPRNRGRVVRGCCLDVTEQRHNQEHIREVSEQLEAVFDASPLAILQTDADGRILRWSAGAQRKFGWTEDEVVGTHCPTVPSELVPDYLSMIDRAIHGEELRSLVRERRRRNGETIQASIQCGPVRDATGRVTGAIIMLEDITARVKMEEQLVSSRDRLADLSRRLLQAHESERRSIAKGLHDEVGQTLTAIRLGMESVRDVWPGRQVPAELEQTLATLDLVMRSVRDLSLDLRPGVLDDLGLAAATRWIVQRIASRAGMRWTVRAKMGRARRSPELDIVCFRILQEALTNVVRHSKAGAVEVELNRHDGQLVLSVRDDGIGIDANDGDHPASGGIGLASMRERAALVGGSLSISSAPREGTLVRACFPLTAARRSSPAAVR